MRTLLLAVVLALAGCLAGCPNDKNRGTIGEECNRDGTCQGNMKCDPYFTGIWPSLRFQCVPR